jgi:hypothetical protein
MTIHKHFKERVRARMERTGESYTTARRNLLPQVEANSSVPWHFPGTVPAATALRSLLAASGVRDPRTGKPFGEAEVAGLAGGIGIGVFAFCYEKEDFASLFIGGRHLWQDDLAYLTSALARFGIKPKVRESTSSKAAEKALREALADGPCIAWVDMASLPHRAMPAKWSGGGYHVVAVYRAEPDGSVLIGDLADGPIAVPGPAFAQARARIKKFKNRLLSIPPSASPKDVKPIARDALVVCHRGLTGEGGVKNARTNFSLGALKVWAERLGAKSGRDSWVQAFPRGARFWNGLSSIVQFVEYWGGGGLGRPLFAEFLAGAGYKSLAEHYAAIGKQWSALANAALPSEVPMFREARALYSQLAELTHGGGEATEIRSLWDRLEALVMAARKDFPLTEARCQDLRDELRKRAEELFVAESQAHAELGRIVA